MTNALILEAPTESPEVPTRVLGPFLALTFVIAWLPLLFYLFAGAHVTAVLGAISAWHPLFFVAVYAPAIAALVLVGHAFGAVGLGRFLSRLTLWRAPRFWVIFLIVGIPAIYFLGSAIKGNLATAPVLTSTAAAMLPAMGLMLILGPLEEIGWRGMALPLLQRVMAPLWAGLLLGVIWAAWHLPAFFLQGTPQGAWPIAPFMIGTIANSVIMTALFNRSGGSILLAMLYHFQLNNPLWPDAQSYDTYFFVLAAIGVVWANRDAMLSPEFGVKAVLAETVEQEGSR